MRRLLLLGALLVVGLVADQPGLGAGTHGQAAALRFDGSRTGALLSASSPKLGAAAITALTVRNGAVLPGRFALEGTGAGSTAVAARLRLVVTRSMDGALVFDGRLADFRRIELGVVAPGAHPQTFVLRVLAGSGRATGRAAMRFSVVNLDG